MPQTIADIMTPDPVTYPASTTLDAAARTMRDEGIGDVLVTDGGTVRGIVTDRDIVVRAIAEGKEPASTKLGDICTSDLVSLTPEDSVDDAVQAMREHTLRRIPVCADGRAVGIVSIGDLAIEEDPRSALADISSAPPDR